MRCKKHYGKRTQEECVDAIAEERFNDPSVPLEDTLRRVSNTFCVPNRTLRRWYYRFLEWGEYPHVIRSKIHKWNKKSRRWNRTRLITDEIISSLSTIIDESPELYLDEIAEELAINTGVHLPLSTLYYTIKHRLNYSLQVCYESAKQRDEIERERYKEALKHLVNDVEQVIVIDETHKDKRASRRRRAWGRRNSGGIALKKWFCNEVRYTMIAGFNIDGFVNATIGIYEREETSNEGAAGTVDRSDFVECVEESLCPVLGDYQKDEKNSIVIMDNASTHMCEEVRELIESKGAYLLYTAPYSPDLSPIEYAFNVYKAYLRRYSMGFEPGEWYQLHLVALNSITRDIAIKEFRHCEIPHADDIMTSYELQQILNSLTIN